MAPLQRLILGAMYMKKTQAGDPNAGYYERMALKEWVGAASEGEESIESAYRAQASYNLGTFAISKRDWSRARVYFAKARELVRNHESDLARAAHAAVVLARWHLDMASFLDGYSRPAADWYLSFFGTGSSGG